MKRILFILLAAGIALASAAQTRTADYMKKTPALPGDSCNVTKANAGSFEGQVDSLLAQIKGDLKMLKQLVDKNMNDNMATTRQTAINQMPQQSGISQADMDQMKNSKNMSAAEKQALASKMMQQQTNMSIDDAKKVGKMSEAGKKAYGEAYTTEMMATSKADPKQQAKDESAKNTYELMSRQQVIQSNIAAEFQKISDLYESIGSDPERLKMLNNISNWHVEVSRLGGIDYGQGHQIDSLELLIKTEKIKYCNKFTPRYRAALRKHMQVVKTSLPEFKNLAEITAEITKTQTGILMPVEGQEIQALEAIRDYLSKLEEVYKFNLYYPEDN